MKTTELRIGNYVNGIYDEGEFIAEVLTVDSEGCLLDANGIYELTSLKVIKPIPLTEEWLIKFGFFEKYKSCCNRWNILSFTLLDNEDRNGDLQGVFIYDYKLEVSYVHQLQNLYFALTNEELIIKL